MKTATCCAGRERETVHPIPSRQRPDMPSAPCDWAEGTICNAEELGLTFSVLALAFIRSVLIACLAVAVTYAWEYCMDGGGEARARAVVSQARFRRGSTGTCIVQACRAASTQIDLSRAADQLRPVMTFSRRSPASESASSRRHTATGQLGPIRHTNFHSDPPIALAKAASHRARAQSKLTVSDSLVGVQVVPTRIRQEPSVTLPRHARKDSHRPMAEKKSARPCEQQCGAFSQLDIDKPRRSLSASQPDAVSFQPERSPASSTEEPRLRRSQRRSSLGPDKILTQVASRSPRSKSAPMAKKKSAKPCEQQCGAFSQLDIDKPRRSLSASQPDAVSFQPERSPASSTEEPRLRRSQRRSSLGPDKILTQVASRSPRSKSAPKAKLSGGARFIDEIFRRSVSRHAETQKTLPETETPSRNPVGPS